MGKRSRNKFLAYIAAFIVLHTALILVFSLTVMRIKSPKVRFGSIAVENISTSSSNSSSSSSSGLSSFNMRLQGLFTVKNTNFGHFKYQNSTVSVFYGGVPVGDAVIPKGRARARRTKKFGMVLDISSDRLISAAAGNNNSNTKLLNEIGSLGVLTLTSSSKLNGKIQLMKVIKKKKSGEMDCSWVINITTREVQNLQCK